MINDDRNMLPIGTLLKQGEYRVERYIASGGFGNTYEVVHTRLPKRFAVKEFFMRGINLREGTRVTVSIEENHESFNQMREKFYKEAERLAVLEESHIVEVTDFFEENQTAYYVMKLIDGESLAATMKRTGKPFTESEVRDILPQVLQALEAVHGQGIYHLDLKPGNIMRDAKGRCWLIDFGASKQLSAKESKTLSTSTGLSYTPGYAPGEQLSGNMNRIGAWTDFYALGATLYNLLSCQTPPEPDDVRFDGEQAFSFPASVSDDMRQLVFWLMQPDYPRRPQKVSEITARLAGMAQPETVNEGTAQPSKVAEEVKVEVQPEVAAPSQASIPTVKRDSAETVQSSSAETVRSHQAETVVSDKPKRRKLWPWIAAGAALVLIVILLFVVNGKGGKVAQPDIEQNDDDQPLYPWKDVDGKWGFIDDTGNVVIPCKWEDANDFHEGLACVQDNNGKYGFIDKAGQLVIACQWNIARTLNVVDDFSEGLVPVKDSNGIYGFIDKTGKLVIPCTWRYAGNFSEGLAGVEDSNEKWGCIDKTGQLVILCQWNNLWSFSEGLAPVQDNNYKYGFIDKTGRLVIPCQWNSAWDFSEGLACVWDGDKFGFGYIDKTGQVVIPCQWCYAGPFNEGLAPVRDSNGDWGYIDKTGQVVIPCEWDYAWRFSEGLAAVQDSKGKCGFIDKTGQLVIPCQFESADRFSEGLACVWDSDGCHYIDKTGRIVK